MSKQPEALRLAGVLGIDVGWYPGYEISGDDMTRAAAMLRRQHALIEEMTHALKAARKALESCIPGPYQGLGKVELPSFDAGSVTYAENAVLAALAKAEAQQ